MAGSTKPRAGRHGMERALTGRGLRPDRGGSGQPPAGAAAKDTPATSYSATQSRKSDWTGRVKHVHLLGWLADTGAKCRASTTGRRPGECEELGDQRAVGAKAFDGRGRAARRQPVETGSARHERRRGAQRRIGVKPRANGSRPTARVRDPGRSRGRAGWSGARGRCLAARAAGTLERRTRRAKSGSGG